MENTIHITVNGTVIEAEDGATILQTCRKNNIEIPALCYLDGLLPDGACRMCYVKVEGSRSLQASCVALVYDGMVVYTHAEEVLEVRRDVLDYVLSTHEADCFNCKKLGQCKLQEYCEEYGVEFTTYGGNNVVYEIDDSNPFFTFDKNKCILCRRCVRVCNQLQCVGALGLNGRGFDTHVSPAYDPDINASACVSCGNCVSHCPTGALSPKRTQSAVNASRVLTVCPYCGVGCAMYLVVKNGKIIDVEPADGGANKQLLCVKGKFGFRFIDHPDRLKTPLIRKDGVLEEATWEEAYELIASKIKETKETYGPDAIMGLASAKCTNEDNYAFQKMMRAAIGTNNVDHCARLCHSSTVHGLSMTLGSGAMTNTIQEVIDSKLIFVTGSNTTEAHPVLGARIRQAFQNGAKIIVADPRRIELADIAEVFLQINPGTNIALYNGMLNVIIEEGLLAESFIQERTEGFDAIKDMIIKDYTPEKVAAICGINADDLRKAAVMYATAESAGIFYSMGVTQFATGTQGVMSISNLALAAGQIGKYASGVNPLRGQNNVQGACDMGGLPIYYPGYQSISDPVIQEKFQTAWGVDHLSDQPGFTLTGMFPHLGEEIKLLYIMGENPMLSDVDINHCLNQIEKLDFLVVQDIFLTETAELADVVLPAAAYAEKEGTFTNTERRVQRVRKAVNAPGSAKPDWEIINEVTKRLGYENKFSSPKEIMDEIATVTPSFGGIDYDRLEQIDGLHWPCPTKDHPGTPVLHLERFSRASGKAAFAETRYAQPKEVPDELFPFFLSTGRLLYQFHTRTMTGKVDGLNEKAGQSIIEVNPLDAEKLGISDGEKVKVSSRRGSITSSAVITDMVCPGAVFMPFHFVDGPANILTNPVYDDISEIPEFKVCACKIERI